MNKGVKICMVLLLLLVCVGAGFWIVMQMNQQTPPEKVPPVFEAPAPEPVSEKEPVAPVPEPAVSPAQPETPELSEPEAVIQDEPSPAEPEVSPVPVMEEPIPEAPVLIPKRPAEAPTVEAPVQEMPEPAAPPAPPVVEEKTSEAMKTLETQARQRAEAEAARITREREAVIQAKAAMEVLQQEAEMLEAAQWAKVKYDQAEAAAERAAQQEDRIQAAAAYTEAAGLYARALEETKARGASLKKTARNAMNEARKQAVDANADEYAPALWAQAQGLRQQAEAEANPFKARELYEQATPLFLEALAAATEAKVQADPLSPSALIENVRLDRGIVREGEAGIVFRSDITLERLADQPIEIAAHLYEKGGNAAAVKAGPFLSKKTGGAYVGYKARVKQEAAQILDFELFFPYSELEYEEQGKKQLEVELAVLQFRDGEVEALTRSERHAFEIEVLNSDLSTPGAPGDYRVVDLGDSVLLILVWIPPGHFVMGSPLSESYRAENEGPQHPVTLSEGFWMSRYEITNAQYQRFNGQHNSYEFAGLPLNEPKQPVVSINWDDAQQYCAWLTARTGTSFRLPTEAEWEYACRAGTTTPWYWGRDEEAAGQYCNAAEQLAIMMWNLWTPESSQDGYQVAAPAGCFKPNAFGLYDMLGNVWEWCGDWYGAYSTHAETDPKGAVMGAERVIRGGSWMNPVGMCRSAVRGQMVPHGSDKDIGFRVVCVPR